MRQMIARTLNCKPHMTMAFVAFVTTTAGVILLAPFDTFGGSPAWRVIAQLHLRGWHPAEESWGALIFTLGVLMWVSLFFFTNLEGLLEGHPLAHAGGLPAYRFSMLVWQLGVLLWVPVGASFLLSKPDSIGAWIYMAMGLVSEWVAWRIGRIIRAAR